MLLLYCPNVSGRCRYVFDHIFLHDWKINYSITDDADYFGSYDKPKINYSRSRIGDALFIQATPLLFEREISGREVAVAKRNNIPILFPGEESDIDFDIFAAIFFLLTRYEEYLPAATDQYGRFDPKNAVAVNHGFLHLPVVDIWTGLLRKLFLSRFPGVSLHQSRFNAILTYDIDVAYKYLGRSFGRSIGSFGKDLLHLHLRNILERLQVLMGRKPDPWDIYEHLKEAISKAGLSSVFFFLLADRSKYDHSLDYHSEAMKNLVKKVVSYSEIGIHPSFYSSLQPEKIAIEKKRLQELSNNPISKSRQHFLKFTLPDTYNSLLSAGISEDYSMGYPSMPGFRAGTCKPFYYYDLKNEAATGLKVFPITCMDATFIYYSGKTPEKALVEILQLLKETEKVEGTFISLFHNEHLGANGYDSKWKNVHDRMITQIRSYLKKR